MSTPPKSPSSSEPTQIETTALHAQTIGVRAGLGCNETSGDVAQAIHLTTTFRHGPAYELTHGFSYARDNNPNVAALENGLAELEGGHCAIAFASGVAAGAAYLQSLAPGTHVIFHHDTYLDFKKLASTLFDRWALTASYIDMTDLAGVAAHLDSLQPGTPALLWFETPSNPQLDVIDIAAITALAHKQNQQNPHKQPAPSTPDSSPLVRVLVDGTFATPALQQPLSLGADVVLQATTKAIGGHSDTMGGALILQKKNPHADQEETQLRTIRKLTGGVMAPFSAWLAARGLQSLHCRVEAQSRSAALIAEFLEQHPRVARVHYPYLTSHPGSQIARQQMRMGGTLVSFQVEGGAEAALNVTSNVNLFTTATSLGGVESLIEHRPSVEGDATDTPGGLLRASIGLEHPDDLIADISQALQ